MIPPQFYGARRDEQTQKLLKALQTDRPIAPVSVASTCVRDVLAFVYAALEKRPELDRAIVITDRAAWAHLVECATSLLLIPSSVIQIPQVLWSEGTEYWWPSMVIRTAKMMRRFCCLR